MADAQVCGRRARERFHSVDGTAPRAVGVLAALTFADMPLNYSKWDNIELSDDEDNFHRA